MIRASGSVKMLPVLLLLLLGCMQPKPGEGTRGGLDTPAAAQEGPYVASTRGQVYYRSGCAAAQRLSPANRRTFGSAAAAEAAGYRPSTAPGCARDAAAPRPTAPASEPRPPRRASTPPAGTTPCIVASVSDGDTLTCRDNTRVRLLLIDAPETAQRPYGTQARDALRRLAPVGAEVRLERDVQAKDRYERTLAYVWLPDGRMANEEMARQGYAVSLVYPPNVRHVERIRTAVEEARRARRGLWATSAFECSPREYRARRCQ